MKKGAAYDGKLIYCINHLIIFLSQNLSEAVDVALAIQDRKKRKTER